MGINKYENEDKDTGDGSVVGAATIINANIMDVDKEKDKDIDASANIGSATTDVDKDEDVGNSFFNVAADKIGVNAEKQLKISKSKLFVIIINRKRSHLLKKILTTKLSQLFPIAPLLS